MNVLVIPEDFRTDQYILKPIIAKMLAEIGKPHANVEVCLDPLLGGVTAAMNWTQIADILDIYRGMVQIFLLIVDRDGNEHRRLRLDNLEAQAKAVLPAGHVLLAENAWQEVEVWALAGLRTLPSAWNWNEVRAEPNPKERYFHPHAAHRNLLKEPGQGRKTLGLEAAQNYRRVRSRCQEDVAALERRLKEWLAESKAADITE